MKLQHSWSPSRRNAHCFPSPDYRSSLIRRKRGRVKRLWRSLRARKMPARCLAQIALRKGEFHTLFQAGYAELLFRGSATYTLSSTSKPTSYWVKSRLPPIEALLSRGGGYYLVWLILMDNFIFCRYNLPDDHSQILWPASRHNRWSIQRI